MCSLEAVGTPEAPETARKTIIFPGIRGPCENRLCPCDLITLATFRAFIGLFWPFSSVFKLEKDQKFHVKSLMPGVLDCCLGVLLVVLV